MAATASLTLCLVAPVAKADTLNVPGSMRVLQEALAIENQKNILDSKKGRGFSLGSSFFQGRASGVDPYASNYLGNSFGTDYRYDRTAELEGDQRVYALMLNGSYDFDYDFGSGLPIRPYMSGSLGMAMYQRPNSVSPSNVSMERGDMVPLFRIGAGVNYQVDKQLNFALDYKAGFSSSMGDGVFTSRSQQPVGVYILNIGMHYSF